METLTRGEESILRRMEARHVAVFLFGALLLCSGGTYGIWATQQLKPAVAPKPAAAFDRPIARLATLFEREESRLAALHPSTIMEDQLREAMVEQTDALTRWILLVFRLLVAGLFMTAGAVSMAVGLTCRQLLPIIRKLRPAQAGES